MADAPIAARPQVFYLRPAPGWLELLHREVLSKVQNPLQKYKFEPKVTLLKSTVKLHRCDWRQGLEVMLRLNTAHDVEWMILESKCNQWSEVDAILSRVPWDEIVPDKSLPIHVTAEVSNGFTTASGKLRENLCRISKLTHVSEGAVFRFKIELRSDFLRISVSLCGEPLYKRNYKAKLSATAPLPEHQAAACASWVLEWLAPQESVGTLFVPFAGTGTLGFESILVLSGAGPGAFERQFSCDLFPCTSKASMSFFRKKISQQLTQSQHPHLIFNEINPEVASNLRQNAQSFLKNYHYQIMEGDFFDIQPKLNGAGAKLVMLNPPFGDRLAKSSSVPFLYKRIGNYFRALAEISGTQMIGGCLCPDTQTWKAFTSELRAPHIDTRHFTHGGKDMRIVRWRF